MFKYEIKSTISTILSKNCYMRSFLVTTLQGARNGITGSEHAIIGWSIYFCCLVVYPTGKNLLKASCWITNKAYKVKRSDDSRFRSNFSVIPTIMDKANLKIDALNYSEVFIKSNLKPKFGCNRENVVLKNSQHPKLNLACCQCL